MGAGASTSEDDADLVTIFARLDSGTLSKLEQSLIEYSKDGIENAQEFEEMEVVTQEEFDEQLTGLLSSSEPANADEVFKMLSADCAGLTKVLSSEATLTSELTIGLSIPNNIALDDKAIETFMTMTCRKVPYLNIGGSHLKDVSSITGCPRVEEITAAVSKEETASGEENNNDNKVVKIWMECLKMAVSSLIVLDLSYSAELNFGRSSAFGTTPHLRRLVLDGCNISTTIFAGMQGEAPPLNSIFFGLVSLTELSMAECQLEATEALEGFAFFSSMQQGLRSTLMSVNLAENPLRQETAALSTEADEALVKHCGASLVEIDGKRIQSESSTTEAQEAVMQLKMDRIKNDSVAAGFTPGGGDLDAADREFTQALKGEKDTTVVA